MLVIGKYFDNRHNLKFKRRHKFIHKDRHGMAKYKILKYAALISCLLYVIDCAY